MTPILVSYYFELSQPQRLISGLKTNFSLSLCTLHTSSNHRFPKKPTTSPDTNLYKTYTNTKQYFWGISPFHFAPVKKGNKARDCWYHGPFCWFINTRFCSTASVIGIYVLCVGSWNSSVGRAPDSRPKGLHRNPGRSSGRIFFSRADFLCWLISVQTHVTTMAHKRLQSFCQKGRW